MGGKRICFECDGRHAADACPEAARVAHRLATGVDPGPAPAPARRQRRGGLVYYVPTAVSRALAAEASAIKARTGRDLTPSQLATELLRAAIGPREES